MPRSHPAPVGRALLGPGDPPCVELFNAEFLERAGSRPVLLVCDHAGRQVPRALGDLGLDPTAYERHIAWDIGAADVARHLARTFAAPLVLATYSRLVIDLNRDLDDPTLIPEISDDTTIPGNLNLAAADREARIEAIFRPYHAAIDDALARLGRGGVPALVSVHTCTPVFKGFHRPWHIGVLWNRDPRLAVPLIANLRRRADLVIGDNQPYSGRDGQGYTVKRHAEAKGLPHVAIEIRQDLVDTRRGAAEWAGTLAAALGPLLEDPALHRIEHY